MLLGGVDVSGRPGIGNYKFMSIVIGTDEKIRTMIKRVGMGLIHMNTIHDKKVREGIISKLNFDGKECIAFCYRLDLDTTIRHARSRRTKNIRTDRMFTACYYVIWMHIQDQIKAFLQSHRCDIHNVVFQCDGDSEIFLKTVGLKRAYKGQAHSLSDAVAWANNNGKEPRGVISQNLTKVIDRQVRNMMK